MFAKTIIEAATERLKSVLRGDSRVITGRMSTGSGTAATTLRSQKPQAVRAEPESPRERDISAERETILDRFEETARLGHVPADALIGQLHGNHCAALAETKRQLGDIDEALAATLLRLDARFPAPLPPTPEKPIPPRRKVIRPLVDIWTKPPRQRPSSTAQ
jgi:hypothetical protein